MINLSDIYKLDMRKESNNSFCENCGSPFTAISDEHIYCLYCLENFRLKNPLRKKVKKYEDYLKESKERNKKQPSS